MFPVITVKIPFITQFHPHHLHHYQVLPKGFPKVIGIRLATATDQRIVCLNSDDYLNLVVVVVHYLTEKGRVIEGERVRVREDELNPT
jgi:hypothetical protein